MRDSGTRGRGHDAGLSLNSHIRKNLSTNRRTGGVLVLALISVVTVAGLAAAFLQLSTSVSRRQVQMRDRTRAFYVAEAGLSEAWIGIQQLKTGAVGSEADPAVFGDGLFWVEAIEEGQYIRLESTGMVASGTATLGLVVKKGNTSVATLGVHSDSDLDLPPGTLLDGYDSRLGYRADGAVTGYTDEQLDQLLQEFDLQSGGGGEFGGMLGGSAQLGGRMTPAVEPAPAPIVAESANPGEFSGRLGSGGNISVAGTAEFPTVVTGTLTPGTQDAVTTTGVVQINGSTTPSPSTVVLPPVKVPTLPELGSVHHTGSDPLLILPVAASLPTLHIGRNAEVIVEGPVTLVVGNLELASGATLYLDTSAGPVSIYVTGDAVMSPTARLANSSQDPADLSLQISAAPLEPISLPAAAPIHGTIYAPNAELSIPPGFELFGSLVAGQITFLGPPKLHFDEHIDEAVKNLARPRLLSWRIIELENESKLAGSPFVRLGVDRDLLKSPSERHGTQPISILYQNNSGSQLSYSGPEDLFDWSGVRSVVTLKRDGEAVVRGEMKLGTSSNSGPSDSVSRFIEKYVGTDGDLLAKLTSQSPLSLEALETVLDKETPLSSLSIKSVMLANSPLELRTLIEVCDSSNLASVDVLSVMLAHSPGLDSGVVRKAQDNLSPADYASLQAAQ